MGINYGSQTLRLTKSVGDLTYYERSGKTISQIGRASCRERV